MGIPDKKMRLAWNSGAGQTFTTTAVSEHKLDLGAADKQMGINEQVVEFLVKTTFTGLDSGLHLQIVDATAANGTTNQRIINERSAIPVASLVAGAKFQLKVPAEKLQRYLAARYEPVSEAAILGNLIVTVKDNAESIVT